MISTVTRDRTVRPPALPFRPACGSPTATTVWCATTTCDSKQFFAASGSNYCRKYNQSNDISFSFIAGIPGLSPYVGSLSKMVTDQRYWLLGLVVNNAFGFHLV